MKAGLSILGLLVGFVFTDAIGASGWIATGRRPAIAAVDRGEKMDWFAACGDMTSCSSSACS